MEQNNYFSINEYYDYDLDEFSRIEDESVENEVDELLGLIKAEKNTVKARMVSEVTTMPSEEREKEGRTINNLKCEIHTGKYRNILEFSRAKKINTDIKKGDKCVVTITNTDIKNINCKIKEIDSNSITILTEEKIPNFSKNNLARIDLIINETTFSRWERNLIHLNEKGKKALKFKLGRIAPETYELNKNISFINKELDDYQKEAVKHAVSGRDFFLIHGPFGTGKTTTIVELILQEIKLGHNILVTAESNVAINNILEKLENHEINKTRIGDLNKIPRHLKNHTINHKLKNHPLYAEDMDYEERLEIEKEILRSSHVVLATNSTVARRSLENIGFDIAIIDEASQATVPSVLIPINKAEKFILIGDHKQLPPVILNNDCVHLKKSLFEELIEKYPQQSQELLIQYRMNEILMEYPNKKFYENKLICSEKSKNYYLNIGVLERYDSSSPLIFIDTSEHEDNKESKLNSSDSYINNLEAKIALEIAQMYLKKGIKKKHIGIIATYADQVRLIGKKTEVDVKSADGFQGSERDIIIASMVRSNKKGEIGFLKDMKRLNVLLTRAKKKLIIIGNRKTLESNDDYKEFIDFCKNYCKIINIKNEE